MVRATYYGATQTTIGRRLSRLNELWLASLDEEKKRLWIDKIINRSDRHGVGGSSRNEASEEEPVARQVCAEWKLSVAWHGGLVGGDSLLNAQPPRLTLVNVCIPSTCLCFYRHRLRLRLHHHRRRYCCCHCSKSTPLDIVVHALKFFCGSTIKKSTEIYTYIKMYK